MSNNRVTVASLHDSFIEMNKLAQLQNARINVLEHELRVLQHKIDPVRKPNVLQRAKQRVRNTLSKVADHRPRIVWHDAS